MRFDYAEIVVVDSSSCNDLSEVTLGDQTFVVAELGREYFVKVYIHRLENGEWPFNYLRIGLFVDGIDVQYWKRLDLMDKSVQDLNTVSATFWGFKEASSELRALTFSGPERLGSKLGTVSSVTSPSILRAEGCIRAIIHEAVVTDGTFDNISGSLAIPTAVSGASDNVKFWQQASLTTAAGRQISEREKFLPVKRWSNVSKTPDLDVSLKYHSRDMIELISQLLKNSQEDTVHSTKKRKCNPNVTYVDLTDDSDDITNHGLLVESNDSSSSIDIPCQSVSSSTLLEQVIDEEISIVAVPKVIPMLDITEDDDEVNGGIPSHAKWSTITVRSSLS